MFIISSKSFRTTLITEVLDIRSLKGRCKSLQERESEEIVNIKLSKYKVSDFTNMHRTVKDSSTRTGLLL